MSVLDHSSTAHTVVGPDDLDVVRPVEATGVRVVPSQAPVEEPARVDGSSHHTLDELLLAAASGDQEAFAALESRMRGLVRANIRRILRDASRSDAATREFFADVRRDVASFDPDRGSAQAWLLTRAHRRAMSGLTSGHGAGC